MAFLFKVFSGSERLREKQKSAVVVNETFKAELKDIRTKLEVENYELQMLVEMIYDSSFPESQKFLKDPSLDRLYGHKETISSLLFGLAAQGIPVASLILAHFQKYGCDAIGDTLMKLLELVRPLLASKDVPEFTSDDILDAIDNHWHSSVRSSPAFGSVRGSRAQSPLNSPRHSFSLLSPRRSVSSPQSPFSIDYVFGSNSGPLSPHGFVSPRNSRSFSIPPTVAKQDAGTSHDRFIATPPRRSLSSQYPDMGSLGERLQTLAEHDDETNGGLGRSMRKHDEDSAEPSSKDGANSWTHKADEGDAPSRTEPESLSILRQGDVNDHTAVENVNDLSSLSLNGRTGENNKVLTINIPRSALSYEFNELDKLEKAGRAQVVDDRGRIIGDVRVKKANETIAGFLSTGSRSDSFSSRLGSDDSRPDGSRPVASREHFDKSDQDLNAGAPPQVGESKDISWDKLGSDVSSPESLSSRNLGSQMPEEAASFPSSIARSHDDDLERRVPESITKELNSADDLPTFEEGIKEENLHSSEDRVDDIKTAMLATSHIAKEMQLQTASAEHDECKEVQDAKVSEPPYSSSDDLSGPSRSEEIGTAVIDSSSTKEVKDKIVETPALDTSVDGYEHGVMDSLSSKVYSYDSRNTSVEENRESDSGSIEEYRSQRTQDEVEQPVITDSSQAKNEELLPQVEAEKLELPVVANPDSRVISDVDDESHGLKLVGEGGDQHEASGALDDSIADTDEGAAALLFPVRVLDSQVVHSNNDISPRSKTHSDDSRNSSIEENRSTDTGVIEVSSSEKYRSETTEDEVEQPVISDKAKNEDHVPHVEAEKHDSLVVTHAASLTGECSREGSPVEDLVEKEIITTSPVEEKEVIDSEVIPGGRNEIYPVRDLDIQMVHSGNDTSSSTKVNGDDSSNSSVENNRVGDSGFVEASPPEEYRSQETQDGVEQPVISDSSKVENEDHLPQLEAEKHEMPTFVNPDSRVISDVGGDLYGLKPLSGGSDEHEGSGTTPDSVERVNELAFDRVNRGIEDAIEDGVSPNVDEEAVVILSPVKVVDIQTVHTDNESSLSSKAQSDDSRNSSKEEIRSSDSGIDEVSPPKEYHSQTTEDEVEQPVRNDSYKAENEDPVPHEMPIVADPDSRVTADIDGESYGPKLVSEGSDQHEASGSVHDSIERGIEIGSGIEDTVELGVSPNADEEVAVVNESKNTPLANGAGSFKNAEAEKSALVELPVPLEGVAIAEPGTSSEIEQSRLLAAEGSEYKGNERPAECILTAMDTTADTTKVLLKDSNGEKDGVIDCMEGNDDNDKRFSSASSVEEDRSLRSVDDEEFSYSSRVRPDDEDVAKKSGIQAEVEAQRPHATGSTAEVGTDIVPQVSFSDYSDVDGIDESSSTSTSSSSSSSSSSDPDEELFSSASSSSSDKGGSSSSSDDESDDASSIPSVRTRGAMPSISSTSLVEDVNLYSVEIEDQHSLSRSSSDMDRVESSIHEAERAGVDEDMNGPKLGGAELHSPSYDSVTFDLTKLSTDNDEDTSSCFSLQSQDDDLPVVTNEQVVKRKSSSCDWLDMISVNYLMGSGSNSPSTSAARMSTVSSGISLHSFSFQRDHEDETADHTTPDVDVAPDSAGSQSSPTLYLDAGPSANHLLDSENAEKSSVENTEGAGVTDYVTLHSDHESDEGDSLGVTHAASLTGEYSRKGSPSEDLVQDEMVTSSPVSETEAIDTEVITGGRNETYPVKELDIQMAHSDSESSPSTKVHSDTSRNSFTEENRGSESGFIEVSPSEYRSQTSEDEVEQSVISDSSKFENEDHLPHVEAKKLEMAIFADHDSRVISDIDGESYGPKLVSEGGDQHEASGSAHDSTERVNEMGSDRVNLGVKDTADYGVSPDVDKEDAVLAHDKEGGALNSQDLADTISEEDQIGAIEHVSKSSESEVIPIYTGENDAQENAIPGTSSFNLLSTGHRDGGHSPVDGVDEVVDSGCQDQVSKLAAPNAVQDEEKVGVSGNEMRESDPGTDVNMQVSTLSVASSEPAVVESQNTEDSERENVLHSPEHAHSLLFDVKEGEITGANCPTPSNIHDGILLSPVEYGHDELNQGYKKQLKVNEAEVSSSSREVEGQALMHNLDAVDSKLMEMPLHEIVEKNSALTISESLRSREHETSSSIEHVDKDPASSEVLKLSGGDASSSGGFPFQDTGVSSNRNPSYQDLHPVNGSFQKKFPESVSSEKEERLPVAMALHEDASRNTPLKDEEASAEVRGTQTAQVLDTEEAHECDTGNERKLPPLEKEVDTFVNTTKPAITGKTEPIRSALHKLMEYERRDSDASSADGPIETMNILDSRGNMVRAVTLPVTMARPRSENSSTPVAKFSSITTDGHSANGADTRKNHHYHDEKTGWNPQEHADYVETTSLMRPKGGVAVPELHNIRDSIISTPAYPKRWEPYQLKKQRFSWQRKRCKILRTLCCSLCSKCSTL